MTPRRHTTALRFLLLAGSSLVGPLLEGCPDSRPLPTDAGPDSSAPTDAGPVVCEPEVAPVCGAARCGDGVVDSCPNCSTCGGPDAGMCCWPQAEACDGDDLGGATCVSLGYGGGTLACAEGCALDVSGCDPCAEGPAIETCRRVTAADLGIAGLAVAVDAEGGVAIAYVRHREELHFARLDAELRPIGDVVVAGIACIGSWDAVALAPSPTGWMIAAGAAAGAHVFALAADGAVRASAPLVAGLSPVELVARPGGQPLLVGFSFGPSGQTVEAAVLDDGGNVTARAPIFENVVGIEAGSSVWTGAWFLVAARVQNDVQIARLSGTTGLVAGLARLGDGDTELAQLAWTGTQAIATWADFTAGATMFAQAIDANGIPRGAPVAFGDGDTFGRAPLAAVSGGALAIVPGYSGRGEFGEQLSVVRLDERGAPLGWAVRVDAEPVGPWSYRLVVSGDRAIVGWLDPTPGAGVVMARVAL